MKIASSTYFSPEEVICTVHASPTICGYKDTITVLTITVLTIRTQNMLGF